MRLMQQGDLVLFYHSNEGLEVVGIATVLQEHYPDTTAEKGDWSAVDLGPYKRFNQPVSLKEIKATPGLQELGLVRNGRLSVMPVSFDEFSLLLKMGKTDI
jgi:predicted RNA-binding protein with PUA-like domain